MSLEVRAFIRAIHNICIMRYECAQIVQLNRRRCYFFYKNPTKRIWSLFTHIWFCCVLRNVIDQISSVMRVMVHIRHKDGRRMKWVGGGWVGWAHNCYAWLIDARRWRISEYKWVSCLFFFKYIWSTYILRWHFISSRPSRNENLYTTYIYKPIQKYT